MLEMIFFYFQSFLSGIIEFGIVYYAYKNNLPIPVLIGIGCAYQFGNIIRNFNIKKLGLMVNILVLISIFFIESLAFKLITLAFIISWNLQMTRDVFKSRSNTTLKRCFRILGFASIFFINYKLILFIFVFSIIMLLIKYDEIAIENQINLKISNSDLIMLTHQLHYFSYCYIVFVLLLDFNMPKILAILIFVLGWITYTSTQKILNSNMNINNAIIAHFLLALTLILLGIFHNSSFWASVFWIITGFFGGTVYILKNYLNVNCYISNSHINYIEDLGHIIGALISLIVYYFTNSLIYPILIAAFFAVATSLQLLWRGGKYE